MPIRTLGTSTATPTREALLDAAERAFAARGFDGASTRDIARDAGLKNQASLYHYYDDKEGLYEAVLSRAVDALLPLWQNAAPGRVGGAADPAAMGAYLDRVIDYLVAHPHTAPLIERAGLDESRFVQSAVSRLLQPLYSGGLEVLRAAHVGWPDDELPHLAAGLYHLIFGYFANTALLAAVLGDDPVSPRRLERQRSFLRNAVARLLASDIAPPPASSQETS
jgi:AcrR family transcriptional regulator